MSNPQTVTRWTPLIREAAARYHIPASVLAAVIEHESGGREGLTSRTGAKGLTQFEPPTARTYHVNTSPGHARSQIFGEAHYLRDLGFHRDPKRALASYAAGPGNIPAGIPYAEQIMEIANRYAHLDQSGYLGPAKPHSSGSPGTPPRLTPGTITQDTDAAILDALTSSKPGHVLGKLNYLLGTGAYDRTTAAKITPGQRPVLPNSRQSTPAPHGNGRVTVAPGANRAGVNIAPLITNFLSHVAAGLGRPITITTGSNHNRMTVDGNVSDHWDGHAADIAVPVDSHQGDQVAFHAFRAAGLDVATAAKYAKTGGLYNILWHGHRVQIIWKTNQGGNHHNHVHVGIR